MKDDTFTFNADDSALVNPKIARQWSAAERRRKARLDASPFEYSVKPGVACIKPHLIEKLSAVPQKWKEGE